MQNVAADVDPQNAGSVDYDQFLEISKLFE
jgi:hypothetical protein